MKFSVSALVPLLLAGCFQTPPSTVTSESQAIVGGTNDASDPSVVLVRYRMSMTDSLCTGEVLSPHVILTAAHCVDPQVVGTGGTFNVFIGNDLRQSAPTSLLAVKEIHFNEAFDVNNLRGGNDVAVVIVQSPLTVTPLKMNRTPITQNLVGNPLRLVGYGITSAADKMGSSAGVRRQTSTTLSTFDDVLINFSDPAHITCEGDSGGPALMTIGGQEVIVGITSFGDQGCAQFGYDTRVDKYADSFVQPFIDQFDPMPPDMTVGADGYPPGSVGASCTDNSQCTSHVCARTGDTGFCTTPCDPMVMTSCPKNTHCGQIDNQRYCVRDGSGSGCSFGGGEGVSAAGLLLLAAALLLVTLRRNTRQRF